MTDFNDTDPTPIPGEPIMIRFTGGPLPGMRVVPIEHIDPERPLNWPPAEQIELPEEPDGYYKRKTASTMLPQPPGSPICRGAEYVWVGIHTDSLHPDAVVQTDG